MKHIRQCIHQYMYSIYWYLCDSPISACIWVPLTVACRRFFKCTAQTFTINHVSPHQLSNWIEFLYLFLTESNSIPYNINMTEENWYLCVWLFSGDRGAHQSTHLWRVAKHAGSRCHPSGLLQWKYKWNCKKFLLVLKSRYIFWLSSCIF